MPVKNFKVGKQYLETISLAQSSKIELKYFVIKNKLQTTPRRRAITEVIKFDTDANLPKQQLKHITNTINLKRTVNTKVMDTITLAQSPDHSEEPQNSPTKNVSTNNIRNVQIKAPSEKGNDSDNVDDDVYKDDYDLNQNDRSYLGGYNDDWSYSISPKNKDANVFNNSPIKKLKPNFKQIPRFNLVSDDFALKLVTNGVELINAKNLVKSNMNMPLSSSNSTKVAPIITMNTLETKCPKTYLDFEKEEFNKLEITLPQDSFCSGFFIAGLRYNDAVIIEDPNNELSARCKHKECSSMPSYKPTVLFSHKKVDNTKLELNDDVIKILFNVDCNILFSIWC